MPELSITHDEIVALLTQGFEGSDIPLLPEDLSTLADHLLGLVALAQKIQPSRDCSEDVRELLGGIIEAFLHGWKTEQEAH